VSAGTRVTLLLLLQYSASIQNYYQLPNKHVLRQDNKYFKAWIEEVLGTAARYEPHEDRSCCGSYSNVLCIMEGLVSD
jgi:hypothetical protein